MSKLEFSILIFEFVDDDCNVKSIRVFDVRKSGFITIRDFASKAFGFSSIKMAYLDEENDWCTLVEGTWEDALRYAKPGPSLDCEGHLRIKVTHALVTQDLDQLQPHALATQDLEQLQRIGGDLDQRRLIPALAFAGLRLMVELEIQDPSLQEVFNGFSNGSTQATDLPHFVHTMTRAFDNLPRELQLQVAPCVWEKSVMVASQVRNSTVLVKMFEVHPDVMCDRCEVIPIFGARFTSEHGQNFCRTCYQNRGTGAHQLIRNKSEVVGVTVTSSLGQNSVREPHGHSCQKSFREHNGVSCNHCTSEPIFGRRFKALSIPDFNLCQICWARLLLLPVAADLRFQEIDVDGLGPLLDEIALETLEPELEKIKKQQQVNVEEVGATVSAASVDPKPEEDLADQEGRCDGSPVILPDTVENLEACRPDFHEDSGRRDGALVIMPENVENIEFCRPNLHEDKLSSGILTETLSPSASYEAMAGVIADGKGMEAEVNTSVASVSNFSTGTPVGGGLIVVGTNTQHATVIDTLDLPRESADDSATSAVANGTAELDAVMARIETETTANKSGSGAQSSETDAAVVAFPQITAPGDRTDPAEAKAELDDATSVEPEIHLNSSSDVFVLGAMPVATDERDALAVKIGTMGDVIRLDTGVCRTGENAAVEKIPFADADHSESASDSAEIIPHVSIDGSAQDSARTSEAVADCTSLSKEANAEGSRSSSPRVGDGVIDEETLSLEAGLHRSGGTVHRIEPDMPILEDTICRGNSSNENVRTPDTKSDCNVPVVTEEVFEIPGVNCAEAVDKDVSSVEHNTDINVDVCVEGPSYSITGGGAVGELSVVLPSHQDEELSAEHRLTDNGVSFGVSSNSVRKALVENHRIHEVDIDYGAVFEPISRRQNREVVGDSAVVVETLPDLVSMRTKPATGTCDDDGGAFFETTPAAIRELKNKQAHKDKLFADRLLEEECISTDQTRAEHAKTDGVATGNGVQSHLFSKMPVQTASQPVPVPGRDAAACPQDEKTKTQVDLDDNSDMDDWVFEDGVI